MQFHAIEAANCLSQKLWKKVEYRRHLLNGISLKKWFITFSYPYMVQKVLLLVHNFEMEILMDLQVLRSQKPENHIFSGWSVCVCLRMPVTSLKKLKKQIISETPNLEFYMCVIGRCYLKIFLIIGQKLKCIKEF